MPSAQKLLSDCPFKRERLNCHAVQAHCRESRAFVLSGNRDATQWLRMRADARMPLTIGGADCRFIKYTVRAQLMQANTRSEAALQGI